ncbi:hypothetical protein V8G54_002487 [Vigna mungo]|uniref:Uncharacterized protein n=1 Tax=Vigna mungo TaxID=3915 RepID=A0AAQ3SBX2_VIGMU
MNPRTEELVKWLMIVATVTTFYFLLIVDYGPKSNVVDLIKTTNVGRAHQPDSTLSGAPTRFHQRICPHQRVATRKVHGGDNEKRPQSPPSKALQAFQARYQTTSTSKLSYFTKHLATQTKQKKKDLAIPIKTNNSLDQVQDKIDIQITDARVQEQLDRMAKLYINYTSRPKSGQRFDTITNHN